MKFFFALSALAAACSTLAQSFTTSVTFDQTFDNPDGSVDTVACSSVLESQGFTTFGQLPGFPFIGGGPNVTGFGSSECGTCWSVTDPATGISIEVLAIDVASSFNVALEAMNALTENQAEFLGRVPASAMQVAVKTCNS